MAVYTVHTRTAYIPTYILFYCPKCKKPVVTVGAIKESSSYSDRGTFTKKGLAKREDDAMFRLTSNIQYTGNSLRSGVVSLRKDYRKLDCKCPQCGNPSIGRKLFSDKAGLLIVLIAGLIFYIVCAISLSKTSQGIGIYFFLIFISFLVGGFALFLLEGIEEFVASIGIKKADKEGMPPLACADRNLLEAEIRRYPAYIGVDFSSLQKYPQVLPPLVKPSKKRK